MFVGEIVVDEIGKVVSSCVAYALQIREVNIPTD